MTTARQLPGRGFHVSATFPAPLVDFAQNVSFAGRLFGAWPLVWS
jgi:hypothetical protein